MELSGAVYLVIAGWGAASPEWVQWSALFATDAILVAFAVLACVVWWRVDRRLRALVAMLAAGGAAWYAADLVKRVFLAERPCRAHVVETVENCAEVSVWSFPSGHAATAGAFAVAAAMFWRRLIWPAVLLAVLEAFLRVFIGVHYPHDVLLGLLFGAVIGLIVAAAGRPGARRPPAVRAGDAATTTSTGA
ncbi:phosphatase PAP2 family protein [Saccharopolyspora halophila]|uniref:Phosphatase PAP2 family protein n=1 Tax=Saccharopolyspora halophila TaxID=405551 RepID=A0ABN3FRV1_9PSEU